MHMNSDEILLSKIFYFISRCGGNSNNFETYDDCVSSCDGSEKTHLIVEFED